MIISYLDQLTITARDAGYPLKKAFVDAGVETSTFYRARHGTNLRLVTAEKVMRVLQNILRNQPLT